MIKNRLFYLAIIAGCFFLFFAFPGKMTIMISVAVLVLPFSSLIQFRMSLKHLKAEQSLKEKRIQKCQPTVLIVNFTSKKFIPLLKLEYFPDMNILVNEFNTEWASVAKVRTLEYEIYSQYRGKYKIGVKKATAYDFLGLFRKEFSYDPLVCKVFPQDVILENFGSDYGQELGNRARDLLSQIDRTMVSDLRQYNPKDDMKDINWKASAKHGALLVKNYEVMSSEGVTIIMDLHENNYDLQQNLELEDRVVSASLAIIRRLVRSAMSVRLLYSEKKQIKQCGRENSFEELLDTTAFVEFNSSINLLDILHTVEHSSTGGTTFLITHNIDDSLCRYMVEQKAYISKIALFYFEAERDPALEEKQRRFLELREKGILCSQIKQQPTESRLVIS